MNWHDYDSYKPFEGVDQPLDLLPRSIARKEHDHFVACRTRRISELGKLVAHFDIRLDNSFTSVVKLNQWFNDHVEIIEEGRLKDVWYSVSIDISAYLGEIIIERCPKVEWKFIIKPKSDLSYHRSALSNFPKAVQNFHIDIDWIIGISPFGKYSKDDQFFMRIVKEGLDLC